MVRGIAKFLVNLFFGVIIIAITFMVSYFALRLLGVDL